jgi:hypothetical protein
MTKVQTRAITYLTQKIRKGTVGGSSVKLAPCIPQWLAIERRDAMQIDADFLNCVGFIGFRTERGFAPIGTCFMLAVDDENDAGTICERFTYLVTARHLVRPRHRGREIYPETDIVYVRLPTRSGGAMEIPVRRGDWTPPPDHSVDICVTEFAPLAEKHGEELNCGALLFPGIGLDADEAEDHGFGIGSVLFIASLFTGRHGDSFNIPVVRIGSVAAMPVAPIREGSRTRPAYLVETRSLGGSSGSPVFFHLDPYRQSERSPSPRQPSNPMVRVAPYKFIGMLIGAFSGNYPHDFPADPDEGREPPTDVDFNAGISIVLPSGLIMELINSAEVRCRRRAALEAIHKQCGYRPLGV